MYAAAGLRQHKTILFIILKKFYCYMGLQALEKVLLLHGSAGACKIVCSKYTG